MDGLRFIGQEDFSLDEMRIINEISNKHFVKISRMIDNPILTIKMKKHGKILGIIAKKVKYSFHLKVVGTDILISASQADWNLARGLHGVFENAISEIEHKIKKEKRSWTSNK